MSIRDDFRMYYRGCYIGVRIEGVVHPFYVDEVDGGGRDWSEASKNSLVFHGRTILPGNDIQFGHIRMDSGNVVLELPELGYIQHRGHHYWLRYRPQHAASKGLSSRRVSGVMSINDHIAAAIFAALHAQPNHTARQFAFVDDRVLYKGRVIGSTNEAGQVTLVEAARYLQQLISKVFPDKAVV